MLPIELSGLVLGEPKHFKIGYSKLLLSLGNDVSNVEISIGLDHTIRPKLRHKGYRLV